ANIERLTEYVAGCAAPTASIATVVPQHCRLLLAPNARPEGKSALARTPPDPTHAIFSRRQTIFGMFTAASSNIGHVQFALVISRWVGAAVRGRSRSYAGTLCETDGQGKRQLARSQFSIGPETSLQAARQPCPLPPFPRAKYRTPPHRRRPDVQLVDFPPLA